MTWNEVLNGDGIGWRWPRSSDVFIAADNGQIQLGYYVSPLLTIFPLLVQLTWF
jgi:hypothetical protein